LCKNQQQKPANAKINVDDSTEIVYKGVSAVENVQGESMSDAEVCKRARKTLGLTQSIWSQFTGIDRTVISKIENDKASAEGVIVPLSRTIMKLIRAGAGKVDPENISNKLLEIPKDRRGPWTGYNVLVSICIENGRQDVLNEVAGIRVEISSQIGEAESMPRSMKHEAEDYMSMLKGWRKTAPLEAQRFIDNAIANQSQLLTWVDMASEVGSRKDLPGSEEPSND
jgi:DNA-binding XRE family transcriptional regulator